MFLIGCDLRLGGSVEAVSVFTAVFLLTGAGAAFPAASCVLGITL